jgi:hypothetical protein
MFTIDCKKNIHNGLWSFDYEFEEGLEVNNEPLMHQASSLIDDILVSRAKKIPKEIEIGFDCLDFNDPDTVLIYSHSDYGGSVYKSSKVLDWATNYEREVWLCPVLTYFFKEPPAKLNVYICTKVV